MATFRRATLGPWPWATGKAILITGEVVERSAQALKVSDEDEKQEEVGEDHLWGFGDSGQGALQGAERNTRSRGEIEKILTELNEKSVKMNAKVDQRAEPQVPSQICPEPVDYCLACGQKALMPRVVVMNTATRRASDLCMTSLADLR